MPAPQTLVVQMHSAPWMSASLAGVWHTVVMPVSLVVGNGVALACMRLISCADLRLPFTASINPATPETIGAEKLVPTLELSWFV